MGSNNTKFYISNLKVCFADQGRVSKSFDNVLKKTIRKRYDYITLRKVIGECEVVLDGETGRTLCRIILPKQMGEKILNKEILLDLEDIYNLTDPIVHRFIKSRFPILKDYSYQLQINN